jgi:hypothetical protein
VKKYFKVLLENSKELNMETVTETVATSEVTETVTASEVASVETVSVSEVTETVSVSEVTESVAASETFEITEPVPVTLEEPVIPESATETVVSFDDSEVSTTPAQRRVTPQDLVHGTKLYRKEDPRVHHIADIKMVSLCVSSAGNIFANMIYNLKNKECYVRTGNRDTMPVDERLAALSVFPKRFSQSLGGYETEGRRTYRRRHYRFPFPPKRRNLRSSAQREVRRDDHCRERFCDSRYRKLEYGLREFSSL